MKQNEREIIGSKQTEVGYRLKNNAKINTSKEKLRFNEETPTSRKGRIYQQQI